jgi:hypothetical protein
MINYYYFLINFNDELIYNEYLLREEFMAHLSWGMAEKIIG